jgi:hypothetical protein
LKLRLCRRGILFLALAGAALAQTESQIESDDVRRVGSRLNCQCGCNDNLNCMMSGGQCPYCKPARKKIFAMQLGGMDDSFIVASFVREVGDKVLRRDPGSLFLMVPYLSLGAGAVSVAFILTGMRNRGRKQTPVVSVAGEASCDDDYLLYDLDTIAMDPPARHAKVRAP